ncbi:MULTISPECIES: hypothetical protein [Vibrio]|uniref:Uncharacterized protein n=2 Tax=Vibrio cholerae TaxID=666 RepID=A0ABD7SQX5_VIBCL|nr:MULTISPECIES: hypothetical protein [Vibrio]EGR0487640.1 hypothetical protein [Vibrio cholerae]EGR1020646.1 hypothetical protein [Vibrio cholerae]EGR2438987.1 hypothetical protein [Vibrio cholerae]EGR4276942.1 hypothetical protein [Vibrio cholerae]EGR4459340.1 hypothetical protein [Vibrio cholerae]
MGFESQSEKSKVSSRRGSKAGIVVSQTYKPSTDSEEMSFRVDASLLNGFGAKIGDRVDVLHDRESGLWMIAMSDSGFLITGKEGAPTGLVRYTLKDGHVKLVNEKRSLPAKREVDETTVKFTENGVIFGLVD